MLPDLKSIETRGGHIALGCTVQRPGQPTTAGLVTAIAWRGGCYRLSVDGCPGAGAGGYQLLKSATRTLAEVQGRHLNPYYQLATRGALEVRVPGENGRIYFADTPEQAIALVAATIGVQDQAAEVAYLAHEMSRQSGRELRWRGQTVPARPVGRLAFVGPGSQPARPAPLFAIGDLVRFYHGGETFLVSGVALYAHQGGPAAGAAHWHYAHQGAEPGLAPCREAHTTAAVRQ